jgi:hypothetical protein
MRQYADAVREANQAAPHFGDPDTAIAMAAEA